MKQHFLYLLSAIVMLFGACSDKSTINQSEAGKVITRYLDANPEYKTIQFQYGELKFNSNKEREDLKKYQALKDQGIIDLIMLSQKKQFLSKDSSYVYQVKLTERAQDYVLKQDNGKATVRAVNYVLSDKPINFEQVNAKNSKVTVTLKKEFTPFGPFEKKDDAFSDFITKTYKLKLDKEAGWKVDN